MVSTTDSSASASLVMPRCLISIACEYVAGPKDYVHEYGNSEYMLISGYVIYRTRIVR